MVLSAQYVLQRVRNHFHEQHEQKADVKEEVGPLEAAALCYAELFRKRLVLLRVRQQVQTRAQEEDAARKHIKQRRLVACVDVVVAEAHEQQRTNAADERC